MRYAIILAALLMCFSGKPAFADGSTTNTEVQGNQGYIYGNEEADNAAQTTTANTSASNDSGNIFIGIFNAVEKLDAWIQRNLW